MKAIKLRLGAKLQRWHLDVGSPSVVELGSWGVLPDRVFPLVSLHSPLPPRTHSTVTRAVALTPGGPVQSPREAGLPRAWGKAGREKECSMVYKYMKCSNLIFQFTTNSVDLKVTY